MDRIPSTFDQSAMCFLKFGLHFCFYVCAIGDGGKKNFKYFDQINNGMVYFYAEAWRTSKLLEY